MFIKVESLKRYRAKLSNYKYKRQILKWNINGNLQVNRMVLLVYFFEYLKVIPIIGLRSGIVKATRNCSYFEQIEQRKKLYFIYSLSNLDYRRRSGIFNWYAQAWNRFFRGY